MTGTSSIGSFAIGSDDSSSEAVFTSSGTSTASFVGAVIVSAVLSASGTSTANFFSSAASNVSGAVTSAGTSTASFVGARLNAGTLTSAGASTAAFVGKALVPSTFTSSGYSAANFVGTFTVPEVPPGFVQGVFTSAGRSTAIFRSPTVESLGKLPLDPYYPMSGDLPQFRMRSYDIYRQIALQCNKLAEEIDKLKGIT
jgi:hypothetical protein